MGVRLSPSSLWIGAVLVAAACLLSTRASGYWGFDSLPFRMTNSELAFSVSINDCEVQTFRAGGKGGQNQNKRNTGVRVIHHESGARGESREERSQLQNKRTAFKRMVDTPEFKRYIDMRMYGIGRAEAEVERMMQREQDFRTEVRVNGRWQETDGLEDPGTQA